MGSSLGLIPTIKEKQIKMLHPAAMSDYGRKLYKSRGYALAQTQLQFIFTLDKGNAIRRRFTVCSRSTNLNDKT